MKNGANAAGIASVGVAVVALVIGLAGLALGHAVEGAFCAGAAVLIGAAGLVWLRHTHRQVRDAELQWHDTHSSAPAPPPTS
jgi:hypothetical protein